MVMKSNPINSRTRALPSLKLLSHIQDTFSIWPIDMTKTVTSLWISGPVRKSTEVELYCYQVFRTSDSWSDSVQCHIQDTSFLCCLNSLQGIQTAYSKPHRRIEVLVEVFNIEISLFFYLFIFVYLNSFWGLKRLEKKLDGNYTRMLRAILNKS